MSQKRCSMCGNSFDPHFFGLLPWKCPFCGGLWEIDQQKKQQNNLILLCVVGTVLLLLVWVVFINKDTIGPSVPSGNWKGEYYNNKNLKDSPKVIRNDGQGFINFDWDFNGPQGIGNDYFSIRWMREVYFENSGTWLFCVKSDDGIRLYLDNNLLIDDWNNHSAWTGYGKIVQVTQGNHSIMLEYYENEGNASIKTYWSKVAPYISEAQWGMTEQEVKMSIESADYFSKEEGKLITHKSELFKTIDYDYEYPKLTYKKNEVIIEYLFTPRTRKLFKIEEKNIDAEEFITGMIDSLSGRHLLYQGKESNTYYSPDWHVAKKEKEDMLPERSAWDVLTPRMKKKALLEWIKKERAKNPLNREFWEDY